jgi:hypothetical protein
MVRSEILPTTLRLEPRRKSAKPAARAAAKPVLAGY